MPWLEFIETCRALAWADDEESATTAFGRLEEERYWNRANPVADLRLRMVERAQKHYVERMLNRHGDGSAAR